MMRIILASASPRRRELLSLLGIDFEVVIPCIDETLGTGEHPPEFCARLSREKALSIAQDHADCLVIAADTVVVIEDSILGKPQDEDQAGAYLRMLRSRVHEVYTGYTVACLIQDHITTKVVRTTVHFRDLSEEEIAWYVATREPMDKAGAYALQGHGAAFIDRIDGSHTNVIGLPLSDLYNDLKTFDIKLKTL
jgi:septum formation protein